MTKFLFGIHGEVRRFESGARPVPKSLHILARKTRPQLTVRDRKETSKSLPNAEPVRILISEVWPYFV